MIRIGRRPRFVRRPRWAVLIGLALIVAFWWWTWSRPETWIVLINRSQSDMTASFPDGRHVGVAPCTSDVLRVSPAAVWRVHFRDHVIHSDDIGSPGRPKLVTIEGRADGTLGEQVEFPDDGDPGPVVAPPVEDCP